VAYAESNMTETELAVFTQRLGDMRVFSCDDPFFEQKVSVHPVWKLYDTAAEKYLEELQRRQRAGEPLIRP
jgi:hypothetical protein